MHRNPFGLTNTVCYGEVLLLGGFVTRGSTILHIAVSTIQEICYVRFHCTVGSLELTPQ